MTLEEKIKNLDKIKKKIKLLNDPLVQEIINAASPNVPLYNLHNMYKNQLSFWQQEIGKDETKWKQLDLEEAIKNELENQ